ncbi:hypothetical protein NHX12_006357 [Muraenolepis orangiensis]|uniref:Uncharacterized protein n=1 Tax=Muraenolepis orangiensis TaxID=630683 RepID=A0A9Q0ID06_9TELE|nr:hypothetical protein NHX12_006357 [Muraenolepis orangiensis]
MALPRRLRHSNQNRGQRKHLHKGGGGDTGGGVSSDVPGCGGGLPVGAKDESRALIRGQGVTLGAFESDKANRPVGTRGLIHHSRLNVVPTMHGAPLSFTGKCVSPFKPLDASLIGPRVNTLKPSGGHVSALRSQLSRPIEPPVRKEVQRRPGVRVPGTLRCQLVKFDSIIFLLAAAVRCFLATSDTGNWTCFFSSEVNIWRLEDYVGAWRAHSGDGSFPYKRVMQDRSDGKEAVWNWNTGSEHWERKAHELRVTRIAFGQRQVGFSGN